MAPVTHIGLVLLTTASAALAHRGHHAGHLHRNKRRQQYYNQNNSTTTELVKPTAASLPDVTLTRTETKTSTITSIVYEDVAATSGGPGALFQLPSGSPAPTCGGTVYVTVTATATVTSGAAATTPGTIVPSAPAAAYQSPPPSVSTSSATTPAAVVPSSPAVAAAPPASTSSVVVPPVAASPEPSPYTPPAAPAPAPAPSDAAPSVPAAAAPSYAPAPSPASAPPAEQPAPVTPSSSSAPVPSSAPAPGGLLRTKRGCLYNSASDCAILGDSSISWATNWASSADGQPGGCTYIPQLWGHTSPTGAIDFTLSWAANAAAAIAAGAPAILGYNEPDLAEQANLSPAAGAALWSVVTAFSGKATIVSPAVTSRQQGDSFPGLDWLSSFKAAGASWDATAIHFYGNCAFATSDTASYTDQLSYLKKMVDQAGSRFGKPVWVTEFGCEAGASPEQIAAFFQVALPYLEGEANVHQYAAFKADLLISGNAPNAAGTAYMKIAA